MASTDLDQHEVLPRWLLGLGASLLTLLALALVSWSPDSLTGQVLQRVEHGALDALFRLRADIAPTTPDEDIVVVVVDQDGLDLLEHAELLGEEFEFSSIPWPWPRMLHGLATEFLARAGARAVFFDFLFTSHSADQLHFGYTEEELGDDFVFAEACRAAGNVYWPLHFYSRTRDAGSPNRYEDRVRERLLELFPEDKLEAARLPFGPGPWPDHDGVQVPIAPLAAAARGLGAINEVADSDRVTRRVQLLHDFQGETYPSIHVTLARDLLEVEHPGLDASGHLSLDAVLVPADEEGRLLLNWHGGAKTYTYYALHKLILSQLELLRLEAEGVPYEEARGEVLDPHLFRDKVVLIGSTAAALSDLKANPFGASYPGIEVHATALDNILNGDFLHRPAGSTRALLTGLLLLLAGQVFMRRQGAALASLLALVMLAGYLAAVVLVFVELTTWLDVVLPTSGLVLVFAGSQTAQYLTEGLAKRRIRAAFQRYLPPAVVDEVLRVPVDELKLGGDRRELTVYFADIVDFTSISERLEPEELVRLLNGYLSEMTGILSGRGATLDKYIGDCIMSFWGAPLDVPDAPLEACLAALECRQRLAAMRAGLEARGDPALAARIGINTGPMLVGNMGSESQFSYTVMGDAVNLASRLEGANKHYGTGIMLGSRTFELARKGIVARELDSLRVKGRLEPETVYELLGTPGSVPDELLRSRDEYEAGLAAFRTRRWDEALARFQAARQNEVGLGPAQVYLERTLDYQRVPPPDDWDGVYVLPSK